MRKLSVLTFGFVLLMLAFSASDLHAQKRRFRVSNKDAGFSMIPEFAVLVPSNKYTGALNFNLIAGALRPTAGVIEVNGPSSMRIGL